MRVYLIGICGTGMGSLATLLAQAGHEVIGSDAAPAPPMSEVLERHRIRVLRGVDPSRMDELRPDLVVVGNVCRPDNGEAARARELGVKSVSMPRAVHDLLLAGKRSLVIAGTHGKTTTTALVATILARAGRDPTALVGGVVLDLEGSTRLGQGEHVVLEGDEYDSAFFEKVPKFWGYAPHSAVLTSVEHDHIDIYPDEASYIRAFEGFVERIAPSGLLVAWGGSQAVLRVAARYRGRVLSYALDEDCAPRADCIGTVLKERRAAGPGELLVRWPDGTQCRMKNGLMGRHNARNVLAAALLCREACAVEPEAIGSAVGGFRGVALRQQLWGIGRSIRVYRDFAHHPAAVRETLAALRPVAGSGRLIVAFEPRTATACRRLHQDDYAPALGRADYVVLAPVARSSVASADRLDVQAIARELRSAGTPATAAQSLEEIPRLLARRARPGDVVLLLSNGPFGNVHDRLLSDLRSGAV